MVIVVDGKGLTRTTSEKELLRAISALENSIAKEKDLKAREQLVLEISSLKENLSYISAPQQYGQIEPLQSSRTEQEKELLRKLKLCRLLISRYSDLLNEKEEKTVGQIKSLVSKSDLTIQSLAQSFMGEEYTFEKNYHSAAALAYKYVVENIEPADFELDVTFWLSAKEIASEKIGDAEDQVVFLCSLLFALGDDDAECIVAELEDSKTHAFVITHYKGKFLLLDPLQKKPFLEFFGTKNEVLENYTFKGKKIERFLYRFNSSKYEQYIH
ncbi:MAG TPA: hypothetical protein VJG83_03355 [archaeon]|nr:hypothetical protein [archaeon]